MPLLKRSCAPLTFALAGYIITQDYKKSGARNRPYQTVRIVREARALS